MLTDTQKSAARHDGGKPLANRKGHLSRVLTTLVDLHNGSGAYHDLAPRLTPNELSSLREAANVLAGVLTNLRRDVRDAKQIKADHDQAVHEATKVVVALITDPVADVIALADLAHDEFNRPKDILTECLRSPPWAKTEVDKVRRNAVSLLAYQIASQKKDPVAYCAALATDMPAARTRHADTIARIQAVLVQAEMERAAA